MERLDKILSHHGFGSRKDVKKLLHSGRVNVNGKICTLPDVSIDLDIDVISIDDEVVFGLKKFWFFKSISYKGIKI